MIVEKVIKVKLNAEEKELLMNKKVDDFVNGGFCEGIDCSGIVCSPDCPLYNLDEQAQALRRAVLKLINGAE